MTESGELRISDADRDAVAERLRTAFGEGRITIAEPDERLGVVYAAYLRRSGATADRLDRLIGEMRQYVPAGLGRTIA